MFAMLDLLLTLWLSPLLLSLLLLPPEQRPWVVMGLAMLYVVPCGVAWGRAHPQKGPIILATLFLGWTGLVWLIALCWSCRHIHTSPYQEIEL
jgi:lipoprotein signal peptidase